MTDIRKPIFDAVRAAGKSGLFNDSAKITALDALLDDFGIPKSEPAVTDVTLKILLEIAKHEGIVPEAYKDSVGVWTWGIGVTNASGHQVYPRYKDNPQTLPYTLKVAVWLMRQKYLPPVLAAFEDCNLTENELGAALSFQYNTGGIARATWVKQVVAGQLAEARVSILNWNKPPEILGRRKAERDLFFDGKWAGDGKALVYGVAKPSYHPKGAVNTDITAAAREALKP
ncbi:hypothetical protein GCM10009127_26460 [Alteraurantiacibacter aestuarii]|uniref:Lysozyme n=1 Tax=Alteraurantiacibacter aestuarii TaxID=650004 RepID=A0A844ZLX4_9SPHN|nr:lysozyme [Alteraurantiacibacter aestuarii]MXO88758.1 hypothetical protein [Alteraurantiacibacter aestuarii]